jgi:hypothetical protein
MAGWGHVCAAQFTFAAFGDLPYNAGEELVFGSIMAAIDEERLAFAIHVGDFKSTQAPCSDELFAQRLETFSKSKHPFVYIPGDNEWIDCRRAHWAKREPVERLAKLREMFFPGETTLGSRTFPVERQLSRGYPEHLRWIQEDVVFATLNVPGPSNNAGVPGEAKPRTAAVLEWMRQAFRVARERKAPAVVLATHANLFTGSDGYSEIVAVLTAEAKRYAGAVLVVHGDTHRYRFDAPLPLENVMRLEVFGSPFLDWVRVTVTVENARARFSVSRGSER